MSKATMPEPVATVRRTPTAITYKHKSSLGVRLGKNDLITTDQAEAYAAARVRELREALDGCYALAIGHAGTYQFNHGEKEIHPIHQAILDAAKAALAK